MNEGGVGGGKRKMISLFGVFFMFLFILVYGFFLVFCFCEGGEGGRGDRGNGEGHIRTYTYTQSPFIPSPFTHNLFLPLPHHPLIQSTPSSHPLPKKKLLTPNFRSPTTDALSLPRHHVHHRRRSRGHRMGIQEMGWRGSGC